ncbi:hypothetical protein BDZ45DRAFT_747515 [Acephala macrosclerotiorum]|nr:hypothetical protein BDZ45DRAFT_747515 [Acephala macrosclerotiorum]
MRSGFEGIDRVVLKVKDLAGVQENLSPVVSLTQEKAAACTVENEFDHELEPKGTRTKGSFNASSSTQDFANFSMNGSARTPLPHNGRIASKLLRQASPRSEKPVDKVQPLASPATTPPLLLPPPLDHPAKKQSSKLSNGGAIARSIATNGSQSSIYSNLPRKIMDQILEVLFISQSPSFEFQLTLMVVRES